MDKRLGMKIEKYLKSLNDFLKHLEYERILLECYCTEFQLGTRRLENRYLEIENIKKLDELNSLKHEEESVDLQQVDDLIEKAQMLLLNDKRKSSKQPLDISRKIGSAPKNPTSINTNSVITYHPQKAQNKRYGKSATKQKPISQPSSRLKSAPKSRTISKSVDKADESQSGSIATRTDKTVEGIRLSVPESYANEFKPLYKESCRLNLYINSLASKTLLEKEKSIQEFMNSVAGNQLEQSSALTDNVEEFVEAEEIVEQFENIKHLQTKLDKIFPGSQIKDLLLNHCQLESSLENLRILELYSDALKVSLENNLCSSVETLKSYRLVNWILCGTLPVLLKDTDTSVEVGEPC